MQASSDVKTLNLRERIIGVDRLVPLLDGSRVPYVNLDNAASTPPLKDVVAAIDRFLPFYSSVHRGTGFKSRLSTEAYEQAREVIAHFLNADLTNNTVVFGKNTTEALNKLSYRLARGSRDMVLTTAIEHHSNDLPWRQQANVAHVRAKPCGRLDEDHFDALLEEHADRLAAVTVTGASNVSGYIMPIHRLARKAHAVGVPILVDAAQLAPHRAIDMKADDDPEHLDYVTISAHKMYAPFGTGALIGPKAGFMASAPEFCGGGTVEIVTLDEVHWAEPPDREEAGSPNVVGAVAMAAAALALMDVGMDAVAAHERELLVYALERLTEVPGMQIYGESDPEVAAREKVGVVPFNLESTSHFLTAAILGYEGGIGVRSGCFCAHPYVVHLLDLNEAEAEGWRDRVLGGDKSEMPGMVRMSLGCYNDRSDVDRLIDMLKRIAAGDYHGEYEVDRASGEFDPVGYEEPLGEYFSLLG